jgi:hypothetical protein
MWKILYDTGSKITTVATWNTNPEDCFDVRLSLFRGPNRIIWYCYNPDLGLLKNTKMSDIFYFTINDEGSLLWDLKCIITYIGWNPEKECMEIRLEPALLYILNTVKEMYFDDVQTLDAFVQSIVPSGFTHSISPDLKNNKLFNNISVKGNRYDVICDLAEQYGYEVYCTGSQLSVGYLESDVDAVSLGNTQMTNNTRGIYNIREKEIACISSEYGFYLPGGILKLNGKIKRIMYTRIHIGPFKGPEKFQVVKSTDVAVTNIAIAVNNGVLISEDLLYDVVPEEDRHYFRHVRKFSFSSFIGITKTDEGLTKKVYPNIISDDLQKPVGVKGSTLSVVSASPYAGDEVGLQFPTQDDSIDLITKHKDKYHAAVSHGQLWSDKVPKRNNNDDFRLTLPDGSTLYHEKSTGDWKLAAKGKIHLVAESSPSYNSVPADGGKFVARKDDATIINSTTDSVWITWLSGFCAVFNAWVPVPGDGGAVLATAIKAYLLASPPPTSMTGKINEGSTKVKLD